MARVGVLALQGGFAAHGRMLRGLGAEVREVRVPADLDGLDGLVMPGGESTTMTLGIEREGLARPLRGFTKPILGTCAGLILLDRTHLAMMDIAAARNAFGRQVHSFEADVDFGTALDGGPVHAIFIRAPLIERLGPGVIASSMDASASEPSGFLGPRLPIAFSGRAEQLQEGVQTLQAGGPAVDQVAAPTAVQPTPALSGGVKQREPYSVTRL